jgi:alpha-beta hydrolase superfamily lysophospholipase
MAAAKRHAWYKTAAAIARQGHVAYALDQRGHGDSEWVASGAYVFSDYAADAILVAAELTRRHGTKSSVIGTSLGGIASLLAEGQSERDSGTNVFSALVLVDITPRVDPSGVAKVLGFMVRMPMKDSRRLPMPPRPSPIICHNGPRQKAKRA